MCDGNVNEVAVGGGVETEVGAFVGDGGELTGLDVGGETGGEGNTSEGVDEDVMAFDDRMSLEEAGLKVEVRGRVFVTYTLRGECVGWGKKEEMAEREAEEVIAKREVG